MQVIYGGDGTVGDAHARGFETFAKLRAVKIPEAESERSCVFGSSCNVLPSEGYGFMIQKMPKLMYGQFAGIENRLDE